MLCRTAPRFFIQWLCLLLAVAALGACATVPGRTTTDDPWQGVNRGIYRFNVAIDRAALKPVAKGYVAVTPLWFRTGIRNFYKHLGTPVVMANELLQGKPQLFAQDTCRFVLNTLVGLGGFIDVAGKLELYAHDEDFGQTLAVWGVPSGPYLMLPLLGPATVRDGFGRVPDYYGSPQRYADIPWEADTGLSVLDIVQLRARLLNVEDSLDQAYDKYGVIRDAWLQRREYQIYDGNPPPEPQLEDESEMDPADDTTPQAPGSNTNTVAP
jgi:phospholipid-binding lipoprotein MlaA